MQTPVVIEALTGTPARRSVRLAPGASAVIGRLPECDLADPGDLHLSRQHCRIEYRGADCVLKNLSSNGTLVNGERVDEVALRDGDRIECSQLRLTVAFAKEESPTQRVASAEVATQRNRPAAYAAEPCSSGLVRYTAVQPQPGLAEMLAHLAASRPAYAIVDFRKIGLPVPENLGDSDCLFYWLPAEVIKTGSPRIVPADDAEQFPEIVERGWGKDGVVCLFSKAPRDELVRHLQDATGYRANDQGGGGMLGYCWPGVLNLLLAHQPAEATKSLMEGIDAVLVEAPDSPAGWNLYAGADFEKTLQSFGLTKAEPAKV